MKVVALLVCTLSVPVVGDGLALSLDSYGLSGKFHFCPSSH